MLCTSFSFASVTPHTQRSTRNEKRYPGLSPLYANGLGVRRRHVQRLQRFRGGLVFKAHRLWYRSTLGLRVIKKKKTERQTLVTTHARTGSWAGPPRANSYPWSPFPRGGPVQEDPVLTRQNAKPAFHRYIYLYIYIYIYIHI